MECSASKPSALGTNSKSNPQPLASQRQRLPIALKNGGRRNCVCNVTDPSLMQDVIIGGAVVAAVGGAFANGLKGEPEICPSCAGSGGVKCFACEGTGKMTGVPMEELAKAAAAQRDPLGRNISKRECVACKGAGMLFCKKCSGTGYVQR